MDSSDWIELVNTTNQAISLTGYDPVDTVTLHYRVHFDSENEVPMYDDGTGPDTVAGDGVYAAIDSGIDIYGPYPGSLENSGEKVTLIQPGAPDPISFEVPQIRIDRVK